MKSLRAPRPGDAPIARDVILIGASVGGVVAIGTLLSALEPDLNAAVAVTLHRGPQPSALQKIFAARSRLEVIEPHRPMPFERGRVYVAPPDQHLVFQAATILPSHAPKENHARPAIDVMFRSGAQTYGDRVVGVVLTGNLKDGVAGLTEITQRGGLSLAQDPAEAHAPSMPLNALAFDDVDVVFRLEALSDVLKTLAEGRGVSAALGIDGTRRPFGPSTADA